MTTQPRLRSSRKGSLKLMGMLALGAGLAAGLGGCRNTLDVKPQGTITAENFFQTQSDAVLATNACYASLRDNNWNEGGMPVLDILTPEAEKGSFGPYSITNQAYTGDQANTVGDAFDLYQVTANNPYVLNWYSALYQAVRRCNVVLERVPAIPMDEALKARLLGEARFLRALSYLDLARAYGDVPLVTTEVVPEQVFRTPAAEIYNNLIKPDLQAAVAALPDQYGTEDYGRATKGAANGLLARAALFFKDYATAETAAMAVVNSGRYQLETDFERAFRPEGNFGPESIFEVNAISIENNAGDVGGNNYGYPRGVRKSPNLGFGFGRPSIFWLRTFKPADTRRAKSILTVGTVLDGATIGGDEDGTNNLITVLRPDSTRDTLSFENYIRKVWPGPNPSGYTVNGQFGFHRRILRYADVLLMAAEAKIRNSGDLAGATALINQVRDRARVPGADPNDPNLLPRVADGLNADQLLQELLTERSHELAFESILWFDYVRFYRDDPDPNRLKNALASPYLGNRYRPETRGLLPIPQLEIDLSAGRISQNAGY